MEFLCTNLVLDWDQEKTEGIVRIVYIKATSNILRLNIQIAIFVIWEQLWLRVANRAAELENLPKSLQNALLAVYLAMEVDMHDQNLENFVQNAKEIILCGNRQRERNITQNATNAKEQGKLKFGILFLQNGGYNDWTISFLMCSRYC